MIYYMNLCSSPYQLIKSEKKTVEMRLNDERRKDIKANDVIIFTCDEFKEKLKVVVLETKVYKDFIELYKDYSPLEIGYLEGEKADPNDMYQYYTKEKIQQYGALAIRIKLIK